MNQKIYLTLTGRQKDSAGEVSVTEHRGEGSYFERNGSCYLLYEDQPEASGCAVSNTVKLKNSVLELTKKGAVRTRMVFEPGREYVTDYVTPYGSFKMELSTHYLDVVREEGRLTITVAYSLSSDGIPVSDCTLTLLAGSVG